jgi:hypothetical protein
LVLGICREFKKLPSEVYAEDAGLLRMLEIERLGGGRDGQRSNDRSEGEELDEF